MKNRGFDFSVGHTGDRWNATIQGSHYKNEIVSIDGTQKFFYGPIATRFGNQVINRVGDPIGSFFGYKTHGYFNTPAEVAACRRLARMVPKLGRIKFVDMNSDEQDHRGRPHGNRDPAPGLHRLARTSATATGTSI